MPRREPAGPTLPPLMISACTISPWGAPSLRSLQVWDAMLPTRGAGESSRLAA
jgi:hypothetical protein